MLNNMHVGGILQHRMGSPARTQLDSEWQPVWAQLQLYIKPVTRCPNQAADAGRWCLGAAGRLLLLLLGGACDGGAACMHT